MIEFEYSYIIILLVPLIYCLYKCKEKIEQQYFVHLHLFNPSKRYFKWEYLLKLLALIMLVIALASPVIIDRENPLNRHGKDIVLAIDASGSMNASGFDPKEPRTSRFRVTQEIATEFIHSRVEDNVGVVLFGDFAFIASPITFEKEMVAEMISYLSMGMAGQNTAIGDAIVASLRAFETSKAKEKIIILLTDGEHNSGKVAPKDAIKITQELGVKIYSIGIGKKGEYDSALLEAMAKDSGGEFFSATSAEELKSVYYNINALESSNIKSSAYLFKSYYFETLLLIALLILSYIVHIRQKV